MEKVQSSDNNAISKTELLLQRAIDIPVIKEAFKADSFMAIVCKRQTSNQKIRAGPHVDMLATNRTLIAW